MSLQFKMEAGVAQLHIPFLQASPWRQKSKGIGKFAGSGPILFPIFIMWGSLLNWKQRKAEHYIIERVTLKRKLYHGAKFSTIRFLYTRNVIVSK